MFAILLGYLLSVSHVFCFTNPAGGTCMCLEGKIICKRIVIVINDSSHELLKIKNMGALMVDFFIFIYQSKHLFVCNII
jgi:hypothetical protein